MVKVLFVCTGNICRSPTAEAVFRRLVLFRGLGERVAADSAGTQGYHVGEPPDLRAREAAARRGVDMSDLRARRVEPTDFETFDLILAMDRTHHGQLSRIGPRDQRNRLGLFMDYAPRWGVPDVPDPYYGANADFERVLDMIEDGSRGLLDHIEGSLL